MAELSAHLLHHSNRHRPALWLRPHQRMRTSQEAKRAFSCAKWSRMTQLCAEWGIKITFDLAFKEDGSWVQKSAAAICAEAKTCSMPPPQLDLSPCMQAAAADRGQENDTVQWSVNATAVNRAIDDLRPGQGHEVSLRGVQRFNSFVDNCNRAAPF